MLKQQERDDGQSCFNRAAELERLFVLREKDLAAPGVIRFWIAERVRLGLNKAGDPKLKAAEREAAEMEAARAVFVNGGGVYT